MRTIQLDDLASSHQRLLVASSYLATIVTGFALWLMAFKTFDKHWVLLR